MSILLGANFFRRGGYLGSIVKSNFNSRRFHNTNMASESYTDFGLNFLKPDLDDRSYRYIKLPNNLKALVIQDPTTDKAAAALDVNVGAFEDPEDLPGLAHFCEHLLFMGSKKFPDENEYSSFLSKHGGSSNAYTGVTNTNYYFEVNHEHLHGALDRFSGFFSCPLFNKDSTEKEIKAVDSENKKNLQSDLWRFYQLDKILTNPDHPYHKFSTGNFKTLMEIPKSKGVDTRDELLKFYDRCYSANLMKLCILGREDLDTLSKWAYELFKDVSNSGRPAPEYSATMLQKTDLQKMIHVKPVKDLKKLEITFAAPDVDRDWEAKPSNIISHLVGHEGSGSLLAHLKDIGLANGLSAGGHTVSKDNAVFSIDVDLTDEGLKNFEDVTVAVFQYIEMLKLSLPDKRIFLELEDIERAAFKFTQKAGPSNTVSSIAKRLEKEYIPVQNILATNLFTKYEPDEITKYVNSLTVENSRIMIMSKISKTDSVEKWYGTEYSLESYSTDFAKRLKSAGLNAKLHLPRPNEFIATNFNVDRITDITPLEEPLLLKEGKFSKLWYKKDDRFWQPRGYIYVSFKLPHTHASIVNTMLTTLYVHLVNDQLKDLQYDASCAYSQLSFVKTNQGLDLTISGFNDKLTILLIRFLEGVKNFSLDAKRFEILKEKAKQHLKNQLYETPYMQVSSSYTALINERSWPPRQKLEVMNEITLEQMSSFVPTLYEEMFYETLVHGNFKYDEANEIDSVVEILRSTTVSNPQIKNSRLRSFLIPEGKTLRYEKDLEDAENVNSCIQQVTQIGTINDETAAKSKLFAQMIHEPCFDTLRTKEQLGYVVFSSTLSNHGTINMRFLIQSERTTPYLEWRIDTFLEEFGKVLEQMTEGDFSRHKDALCKSLLQKYKNMREESSRFSTSIYLGDYDFTNRRTLAKLISELTKKDMMDFYNSYIVGPKASKIILHLKSQKVSNENDESLLDKDSYPSGELIKDIGEFKSGLFLAPVRQPVKKFDIFTPRL